MAQIENRLENILASLNKLKMKYPDKEKVQYVVAVTKIAEDAAEVDALACFDCN